MEVFLLAYSPFWIAWVLCIVVPFELYEHFDKPGYLAVGLATALPCVALPLMLDRPSDKGKPLSQQYWLIANVWIAIFSYVGNYFWTHYFYTVLGAAYTMPAWYLNEVPIAFYLMTHAYFCFYHALANVVIRRVKNATKGNGAVAETLAVIFTVFALSYTTAFMEILTIAHYPYYTFKDKFKMYTVGSLFYAIYFFVSFPMFFRIGEDPSRKWTVGEAALDSLAAAMLVTIILDLWRLALGGIVDESNTHGLPWMPQ